jgi:hypothetical protein
MLTNFRTKQKQKYSLSTQLWHKRRAYERMREIKRVMFACTFFVMFVHVYVVLFLMRGVRQYNIFFLSWCYSIDEKKSEMMVIRFKLIKPTIILWVHFGHTYAHRCIIDSSIDESFWFILCFMFSYYVFYIYYGRFRFLLVVDGHRLEVIGVEILNSGIFNEKWHFQNVFCLCSIDSHALWWRKVTFFTEINEKCYFLLYL